MNRKANEKKNCGTRNVDGFIDFVIVGRLFSVFFYKLCICISSLSRDENVTFLQELFLPRDFDKYIAVFSGGQNQTHRLIFTPYNTYV